ncbi:MAG: hypothetical protein NVS1B7_7790 [Candidatus Saccharimonadales bacterium]
MAAYEYDYSPDNYDTILVQTIMSAQERIANKKPIQRFGEGTYTLNDIDYHGEPGYAEINATIPFTASLDSFYGHPSKVNVEIQVITESGAYLVKVYSLGQDHILRAVDETYLTNFYEKHRQYSELLSRSHTRQKVDYTSFIDQQALAVFQNRDSLSRELDYFSASDEEIQELENIIAGVIDPRTINLNELEKENQLLKLEQLLVAAASQRVISESNTARSDGSIVEISTTTEQNEITSCRVKFTNSATHYPDMLLAHYWQYFKGKQPEYYERLQIPLTFSDANKQQRNDYMHRVSRLTNTANDVSRTITKQDVVELQKILATITEI